MVERHACLQAIVEAVDDLEQCESALKTVLNSGDIRGGGEEVGLLC